jgi:hypothetical protein
MFRFTRKITFMETHKCYQSPVQMAVSVAKTELDSLTNFQKDIHSVGPKEAVISHFYRCFTKCLWYSTALMKLKASIDNDETVYTVNSTFHFLTYSYMCGTLPPVRVKNEYRKKVRIAWPHNVGTNIVESASFYVDDAEYHWWDNIWADIYFQFFMDKGAGKRRAHNQGIGNVKCLEEWTDYLPAYDLDVYQPWFYGACQYTAFPIFCCNSLCKIEHRYTFRRKIRQLLRMQVQMPDGTWKDTTAQMAKYLDNSADAQIPIPQLWGRYAYVTDAELDWFRCKEERYYYIRNVVACDTLNSWKYGNRPSVSFDCNNPCVAAFWVAENVKARTAHNFSNYTTDSNDLYLGYDPIKSSTLSYGTDAKRFSNMPSHHFNIAESRKHFKSAPSDRGYHGHSFSWNCMNYDGDIGVSLKQVRASLSCVLADTNIYLSQQPLENTDIDEEGLGDETGTTREEDETEEDVSENKSQEKFDLRVRVLVVRKLTITRDGIAEDGATPKMRISVL